MRRRQRLEIKGEKITRVRYLPIGTKQSKKMSFYIFMIKSLGGQYVMTKALHHGSLRIGGG
jgi:hypothetical protein